MSRPQVQSSVSKLSATGTILIMADNHDLSEWIVDVLDKASYLVQRVANGADSIDIPLDDVQLAMLIGSDPLWIEQACAIVRQRARNLAVMILGPNNFEAKVRLFDIGADAYLAEPFVPEEILARITSLIRIYRRKVS
jgi:DNA-binding response OmpR family regulator